MSRFHQFLTVLRLVRARDWRKVNAQIRSRTAAFHLRFHGGRPFAYRGLGFPFVCHPDWPDSRNCLSADWDWWELRVLRRWLEAGDSMVDVGANLGLYSMAAAARVRLSGQVLSVDASPFIVGKLQASAILARTPQLEAIHAAIVKSPGTEVFFERRDQTDTGAQSLRPSEEERAKCAPVEVPGMTLAELALRLRDPERLAFVKIDIEGAEGAALESAPAEWFGANAPFWMIEVNPGALARFGGDSRSVTSWFSPHSFERWYLTKHPVDPTVTPALRPFTEDVDFTDGHYHNFFAIPKDPRWSRRRARIRSIFKTSS